jgi:hypothetical protein
MKPQLVRWAGEIDYCSQKRSLDPLAAEIVGARLMRLLGIGAPTEIRATGLEAALAGREWICKTVRAGRLKQGIGWRNVLVRRIPCAISLSSLAAIYGISSEPVWKMDAAELAAWPADSQRILQRFLERTRRLMYVGLEEIAATSDFGPPADWTAVRAAIAWDSPQMLLIHSARLLLGCSAGHSGNILIGATGKLYSVDHELCIATDCAEFRWMAENVRRGTKAWTAIERIGRLDYSDVESLFDDLPAGISWPMGDREKTAAYFGLRLAHWKANMELQSRAA